MKFTRTLFLFVLALASDSYYQQAKSKLRLYNSNSIDILQVKNLLELSSTLGNPNALCDLGQYWFIGHPVSQTNPIKPYIDQRNLTKAIQYFKEAHRQGSREAPFFLAAILQHTFLIQDWDQFLPPSISRQSAIKQLLTQGQTRKSEYSASSHLSLYQQCIGSHSLDSPSILNQTSLQHLDFQTCGGSCQSVAQHAYLVAKSTIEYTQLIGRSEYPPNNLYDDEYATKGSQNSLILASKFSVQTQNPFAYQNIGDNYMFGNPNLSVEPNYTLAQKYYEYAAAQGNMGAMENLGIMHLQGLGIPQNYSKALQYLNQAAELRSANAYNGLGFMYLHGLGVEMNHSKAKEYFKIASDAGLAESMSNLGSMYLHYDRDYQTALNYLQPAAAVGSTSAQFNLGVMHLKGLGLPHSCRKALQFFRSVIEKGQLNQFLLKAYTYYRQGDFEGAYLTYMVASLLGFQNAQMSMAYLWEQGLSPFKCRYDPSYCRIVYYNKVAQTKKSPFAFYKIGEALYGQEEYKEAYQFFTLGKVLPQSLFNMAYMNEHGLGVDVDYQSAKKIYEEIVEKANEGEIQSEAAYPAKLALAKLETASYLQEYPTVLWMYQYILSLIV